MIKEYQVINHNGNWRGKFKWIWVNKEKLTGAGFEFVTSGLTHWRPTNWANQPYIMMAIFLFCHLSLFGLPVRSHTTCNCRETWDYQGVSPPFWADYWGTNLLFIKPASTAPIRFSRGRLSGVYTPCFCKSWQRHGLFAYRRHTTLGNGCVSTVPKPLRCRRHRWYVPTKSPSTDKRTQWDRSYFWITHNTTTSQMYQVVLWRPEPRMQTRNNSSINNTPRITMTTSTPVVHFMNLRTIRAMAGDNDTKQHLLG